MNPSPMGQLMTFAIVGVAVWAAGWCAARTVNQHGRYVGWSKRTLRSILRRFGRMFGGPWRRWHIQIKWFFIGALSMLALLIYLAYCRPPSP